MKAEDLKTKTEDELKKLLLDARKEQMNLRFQMANGQLEKTHGFRQVRRNIAKIKHSWRKLRPPRKEKAKMPRRILEGDVVSDQNDKTITVLVERRFRHPVYKKYIKKTTKYRAHDEANAHKIGDRVSIIECRPISKNKTGQS